MIDERYAESERAFRFLRPQPLPDPRLRACRDAVVPPIFAGGLPLGGEYFDGIARPQSLTQRNHPAIDARSREVVADLRMDPIGEVDYRRPLRKIYDVALGGEHEDFLGEQIVLDGGKKFLGVFQVLLPLDEPPQPCEA